MPARAARGTAGNLARLGEPVPGLGRPLVLARDLACHAKVASGRVSRAGPDRTAACLGGGRSPGRRAEVAVTGLVIRRGQRGRNPAALPPAQSVTHGHRPQGQTSCEFRAERLIRTARNRAG